MPARGVQRTAPEAVERTVANSHAPDIGVRMLCEESLRGRASAVANRPAAAFRVYRDDLTTVGSFDL